MKLLIKSIAVFGASMSLALAANDGREFVEKAAISGQFEIQSSQLALKQSQDEQIRDFAQEMIDDHQKANEELKRLAMQEKINLPTELDQAHRDKLEQLREAGDGFDSMYKRMQHEGHQKAVKLFDAYTREGDNETLKDYAEKTLPILKEHEADISALTQGAAPTR